LRVRVKYKNKLHKINYIFYENVIYLIKNKKYYKKKVYLVCESKILLYD